jgi:hypothetical protein
MVRKLIGALGLLCCIATAVYAAWPSSGRYAGFSGGYFWAANGSDSNNCLSMATPCQTVSRFNSFPFPGGAVVHFRGGDTFSGGLLVNADFMTITSYGTGQPTFNTNNSTICINDGDYAGVHVGHQGLTVNNIACVGGGNFTSTVSGITNFATMLNTSSRIAYFAGPTITNNTVSGYGQSCIDVGSGSGPGSNAWTGWVNTTISGNTTHDCTGNFPICFGGQGCTPITNIETSCINATPTFQGGGSGTLPPDGLTASINILVSNNTVFNCPGTAGGDAGTTGIEISWASNVTVQNNVIHNVGANNSAIAGPGGSFIISVRNMLFQFNEIYAVTKGLASNDGEGVDVLAIQGGVVQYNYVHDSFQADLEVDSQSLGASGPPNTANVVFRYNITEQGLHGDTGINLNCAVDCLNIQVYNNTINNNVCLAGIPAGTHVVTANLSNNVCTPSSLSTAALAMNSMVVANNQVITITGNDWCCSATTNLAINANTYTSLAAFQAAGYEKVGATPVGTTANPNLVSPGGGVICGGYVPPCPSGYKLQAASIASQPNGLNLPAIYGLGFSILGLSASWVSSQDFYGNTITSAAAPIGAHIGDAYPGCGAAQTSLVFSVACSIIIQPMS